MAKAKKILVIDDNKDICYSVKRGLESLNAGFTVVEAIGGKNGLAKVQTEKPDLILLDLMMPDIDGWTVFARLKSDAKTKDIPVIFLTALSQKSFKGYESLAGHKKADVNKSNYIMKPFDLEDLRKKIDMFIK